jgi:dTDP-glucose 4,6-dehydratase
MNVRDWIHVHDHCDAILAVYEQGRDGEIYNIGGENELTNRALTEAILAALGKDESMIERVKDRLGHDRRYAIDCAKIKREIGWSPQVSFDQGLPDTVQWYIDNEPWWQAIKSGAYQQYYEKQYGTAAS